jgi:integrase/recombinase XerD
VEKKSRKTRLPRTKSPEEWAALFAVIDLRYPTAVRNYCMLRLCYTAGLRIGEVLSLHVGDVDIDRMRVRVRQGKSGERMVPLADDPELFRALDKWLLVREEWRVESPLLFVTKAGKGVHANAARSSMRLYAERAGIGRCSPHWLRHGFATELLANGAPPLGVQRCLGHRSLTTTLTTYAHAADVHASQAMARRFAH